MQESKTTNRNAMIEEALAEIPTSWLDPVFHKNAVGKPPYSCPQVEMMFRKIKERIEALKEPT
jgi:hypothetical protein